MLKTSFNLVVTGFINPVVTRCQTNILNPVVMGFVNPVVTGCLIFMSKEHFFDFAVTGFINPVVTRFSIFCQRFAFNPSVLNLTSYFLNKEACIFWKFDIFFGTILIFFSSQLRIKSIGWGSSLPTELANLSLRLIAQIARSCNFSHTHFHS